MKTIKNFVNIDISKFSDLFDQLSNYIFDDKKILIAVSGWPDSMFLSVLIYNFFVKNNLSLNNLYFVHCNHNTREETDSEQKFVEGFFDWLNLSVSEIKWDCFVSSPSVVDSLQLCNDTSCHPEWNEGSTMNSLDSSQAQNDRGKNKTESSLRQWRYGEFQKVIDDYKIDLLLTWHNLTDRIESTLMNMFRGAWLNWFLSMRFVDISPLVRNANLLRPLLHFTKWEIEEFCVSYEIPFVVDQTNFDIETSMRNNIRLSLFPELAKLSHKHDHKNNTFFDSMKRLYNELDEKEKISEIWSFVEMRKSYYRNAEFVFIWDIPTSFVSADVLLKVLKKFNISSNVQKKTLDELVHFFASSKQWYKYINGVYFFLSHGKIYIIKAKENFWQKYIEKSLIIDKLWELKIGKEIINIQDKKFIWLEVRYPKLGDKIGSKSWSKYCINHKIPLFWRNFVPIVIQWNDIIEYFYIW